MRNGPPARSTSAARYALEHAYRYLYALGSGAVLYAVGPFSARHRRLLNDIARHFGYREPGAPTPELPRIALHDLVPPETCVSLREPEARDGNVTLFELFAICSLVRHFAPRTSFEIGTFNGRTAINISGNSPADSVTHTLDLPAEGLAGARLPVEPQERRFVLKPASGALIASAGAGLDIRQLYGDSGSFDFRPYHDTVEFVFIDGSHSYPYVLNDSARALELVGESGVVLWHDYGGFPGVTRALNELHRQGGIWSGLRHLEGTSLAVLFVGDRVDAGGAVPAAPLAPTRSAS